MQDPAAELAAAAAVQIRLLPPRHVQLDGLEGAACWVPAGTLGGDLYDWVELGRGRLGVLLADVEGHGAPAALIGALLRPLFRQAAAGGAPPGDVLAQLNRELLRLLGPGPGGGPAVTALYALFDRPAGRVAVARAGHPPMGLCRNGRTTWVEPPGFPLGWFPEARYAVSECEIRPGDTGYFFTDGLQHGLGPADGSVEQVGGLLERLLRTGRGPRQVCATLHAWLRRRELCDDVGAVLVRVAPVGGLAR